MAMFVCALLSGTIAIGLFTFLIRMDLVVKSWKQASKTGCLPER